MDGARDGRGNMTEVNTIYDDTVYCAICGCELRYNRKWSYWFGVTWKDDENSRCWNKRSQVVEHEPLGNKDRLDRWARRVRGMGRGRVGG